MGTHPSVPRRPGAGLHRRQSAWAAWEGPCVTLAGPATAMLGWATLVCGVLLAIRRIGGAFDALQPAIPWAVAAVGIALVTVTDLTGRATKAASLAARCGLVCGLAAVVPLPRGRLDWLSLAALATVSVVCVAGPLWSPTATVIRQPRGRRSRPVGDRSANRGTEPAPASPPCPGRLQQRLERFELRGGADCLRGRLNLAVAAGSRTGSGHVGFCPAFAETPAVQVTTDYDGVEAVVSAAEVLPWGVRVECRLAEPAEEPLEIPVDVFVQSPR
jgi:hypothetical protein